LEAGVDVAFGHHHTADGLQAGGGAAEVVEAGAGVGAGVPPADAPAAPAVPTGAHVQSPAPEHAPSLPAT
jgi:hypothetical protein